jgi:hypothetical protein
MANWDKTQSMKRRLQREGKLDEGDVYQGRPIIHRDSPVNGGVYLGEGQREAIVVDSKKYTGLSALYAIAKDKATVGENIRKDLILEAVFQTVREAMPKQDLEAVQKITRKHGVEKDGKIALDVFLEEHTGVCRHDALTCAALLELFKGEGHARGKASVDRNSTEKGGHAWCRYTNSDGIVFILDVAQDYLGRLEKAPEKKRWAYERPEDF